MNSAYIYIHKMDAPLPSALFIFVCLCKVIDEDATLYAGYSNSIVTDNDLYYFNMLRSGYLATNLWTTSFIFVTAVIFAIGACFFLEVVDEFKQIYLLVITSVYAAQLMYIVFRVDYDNKSRVETDEKLKKLGRDNNIFMLALIACSVGFRFLIDKRAHNMTQFEFVRFSGFTVGTTTTLFTTLSLIIAQTLVLLMTKKDTAERSIVAMLEVVRVGSIAFLVALGLVLGINVAVRSFMHTMSFPFAEDMTMMGFSVCAMILAVMWMRMHALSVQKPMLDSMRPRNLYMKKQTTSAETDKLRIKKPSNFFYFFICNFKINTTQNNGNEF